MTARNLIKTGMKTVLRFGSQTLGISGFPAEIVNWKGVDNFHPLLDRKMPAKRRMQDHLQTKTRFVCASVIITKCTVKPLPSVMGM